MSSVRRCGLLTTAAYTLYLLLGIVLLLLPWLAWMEFLRRTGLTPPPPKVQTSSSC